MTGTDSDDRQENDALGMKAFMPFAHYLRRMMLPLQVGAKSVSMPARVYNPNEIRAMGYRGLTGVSTSETEEAAIVEAENIASKRGAVEWLAISIPPKEMYLDLEKDIESQSEYVKANIFGKKQLGLLFIDESTSTMKIVNDYVTENYEPEDRRVRADFELNNYYKLKEEEIMEKRTARAYIDFLNEKGKGHDSNMTTSYLYNICSIKGLLYGDEGNRKILLFNAKEDIRLTGMTRSDI